MGQKWFAGYVALSRVRSLKEFRAIGLTEDIRNIINGGPPEGPLTNFMTMFETNIQETQKRINQLMQELNWGE